MSHPDSDKPPVYRVDVSDTADAEADAIFLWIGQYSSQGAARWYTGLLRAYQHLEHFPYSCEAVPGKPGIRRMIYGKYRIVYRVIEPNEPLEAGTIRILRIYHGAQYTGSDPDGKEAGGDS